jgi:potassium efflux system protein
MEPNSIAESVGQELNTILILLERPIVQIQLVSVTLIVLIGWVLSAQVPRLSRKFNNQISAFRHQHFIRVLLKNASLPFIIFFVLQITILVLKLNRFPVSILQDTQIIISITLAYQLVLSILYLHYSSPIIKPFHVRIFRPTLIILFIYMVINNFVNINLIRQIPLLPLLNGAFNVGVLLRSGLIIYLFVTVAYFLKNAQTRPGNDNLQQSASILSILIVSRYLVITIGILMLAASWGINLATLTLIGGGLSIGIGFGLQQIIANFISGILLLFEQSLRPGDVIDLDGNLGRVQEVNIRSTTILTNDNVEIIVPNERFLITNVTTYTRDSKLVRVAINFGVSYASDPQFVRDLAIRTVSNHGGVKAHPAPQVRFLQFGDSSLDFRVLVWMDDPILMPRFRSDLYFMLWEAFAKNNIEIPFPQRDIHIRSGVEHLIAVTPTANDPV